MYAAMRLAERFVTGNSNRKVCDGEMTIGRYSPANPLSEAIIQAASEVSRPFAFVDANASRHVDGIGLADMKSSRMDGGPARLSVFLPMPSLVAMWI